jgi:Domain of unknown function (DUF4838)
MLSFRHRRNKRGEKPRLLATAHASHANYPRVRHAPLAPGAQGEVAATAASELAGGLGAMLGRRVDREADASLDSRTMRIDFGAGAASRVELDAPAADGFAIGRAGARAIAIRSGSERGLIHAGADLLGRIGAQFAPGAAPEYPRIEEARVLALEPYRVEPAFARRAFVSDIMTWNYSFPDRFALHLRHDHEFIPWMARRGINAFSYIRHAHDTRLRIEEIAPLLRAHGIAAEYGGHVLQILLARERFEREPKLFPAGEDGTRMARGNLCVSNPAAVGAVRDAALRYVEEYPENELLHIWGADVWAGAWCRCGQCRELPPQLQYMEVVNAIAQSLGERGGAKAPPVAYLAYHDTIEPHRGLSPLPNVWFEWAPRERCYSHAIDDPDCETNPRYFDSLKRYTDLFEGRGHIFEYYADAILFGGLAFATPAIVARDLRAYRALGITSVSCLTFGAFSVLAYPANLEAFVRCARDVGADPEAARDETAAQRHPRCAPAMTAAYRAVERASRMVLDYADVMQPVMGPDRARRKRGELTQASLAMRAAVAAAESIAHSGGEPRARAERQLWQYSAEVLEALSDYLAALEMSGAGRSAAGERAISRAAAAIEIVRRIDLELKGTWGAYDLEWIREFWLSGLRSRLEKKRPAHEEIF